MKNLVVVESPTKARTLGQFLGSNFQVLASLGHVRDLPRGEFGVNPDKEFEPKYVIPKKKQKMVNNLKKELILGDQVYLATDPDREGEAIAWHLWQLVKNDLKKKPKRVVFHEITKNAVDEAFAKPSEINMELVDAQQARRVLDRLVGYKLSPLLWQKIRRGLSAGRVQSVTLRLIVEREKEIEKFKPQEYWTIAANLETKDGKQFTARLAKKGQKEIELKNKKETDEVLKEFKGEKFAVEDIDKKEVKSYPAPPFTTSTLQQQAATRLGFTAKKTMLIAQELYERGLITYMRTDSVNLAEAAIGAIRNLIDKNYGKNYLSGVPKRYKVKSKVAQEAHEAIRPAQIDRQPGDLSELGKDFIRLYDLIWRRAVACQMKEAVYDETRVDITAGDYLFVARGSVLKFAGWQKVYEVTSEKLQLTSDTKEERSLPDLKVGEVLKLLDLLSEQHFTEPPARYSDATLVKALEQNGIGRPSTYAPIISTILERGYVEREERKFKPTDLGIKVCDFLVKNFPDIVDVSFTAEMEEGLDGVARGERDWRPMISEFWHPFIDQIDKVEKDVAKIKLPVEFTDEKCDSCGKLMVVKMGRYGKFLACSGFPNCLRTKPYVEKIDALCPRDGGRIIVRRTRRGKIFYGCENWPGCNWASWSKPSFAKALEGKPTEKKTSEKLLPKT